MNRTKSSPEKPFMCDDNKCFHLMRPKRLMMEPRVFNFCCQLIDQNAKKVLLHIFFARPSIEDCSHVKNNGEVMNEENWLVERLLITSLSYCNQDPLRPRLIGRHRPAVAVAVAVAFAVVFVVADVAVDAVVAVAVAAG